MTGCSASAWLSTSLRSADRPTSKAHLSRIPDLDRPVVAGGRHQLAVGTERDRANLAVVCQRNASTKLIRSMSTASAAVKTTARSKADARTEVSDAENVDRPNAAMRVSCGQRKGRAIIAAARGSGDPEPEFPSE